MVKLINGIGILAVCVWMTAVRPAWAQSGDDGAYDYGWKLNDGVLEYIIQVRPEQLAQMQGPTPMEKESVMPIELVGRVRKVIVRVGTERLPRTPSLQQIEQTVPRYSNASDVISALGPGRISDVESGSVVNVQEPGIPSLPPPGSPSYGQGNPPATNLADQAAAASGNLVDRAQALAGSRAGQDFMSGAQGNGMSLPPGLPATNPNQLTLPGTSKFSDTAPARSDTYSGGQGQGAGSEPPNLGRGLTGNAQPTGPAGGAGTAPGLPYDPRGSQLTGRTAGPPAIAQPRGNGPAGFGANGYPATNPTTNRDIYGNPSDSGVADRPLNGWAGTSTGPTPQRPDGYPGDVNGSRAPWQQGQPAARPFPAGDPLASNPAANHQAQSAGGALAGTSASDRNTSAQSDQAAQDSSAGQASSGSSVKRTGDVLMQMFFLVSLVANVYLVFLIRKLLTRYRSLLTTVRSQTA